MRLTLAETIALRDPPAFELPNVALSVYISGNGVYSSMSLYGISSAQLHDIIGCTAIKFTGERRAAYLQLVAEEMRFGPVPCADCDSGAPDIPPHDCTKYAKEEAR